MISYLIWFIEVIYFDGFLIGVLGKDVVVYLCNIWVLEYDFDMGFVDILWDMDLVLLVVKLKLFEIKVYFEDDEVCEVFVLVIWCDLLKSFEVVYNIKIKLMLFGVGCFSLVMFLVKDLYFKIVVLVVDVDG